VLRILVMLVGMCVLRMRVTLQASTAHACDVEMARYRILFCVFIEL